MIKYFLTIFIILSLSTAGALETLECHDDIQLDSVSGAINSAHSHQADSGCEDDFGHCSHHCSGIHNILEFKSDFVFEDGKIYSRYVA